MNVRCARRQEISGNCCCSDADGDQGSADARPCAKMIGVVCREERRRGLMPEGRVGLILRCRRRAGRGDVTNPEWFALLALFVGFVATNGGRLVG